MSQFPHLICHFGTNDGKLLPSMDWRREMKMPNGRPAFLSERDLGDAVFEASIMGFGPLIELKEFRRARAFIVQSHFAECARIAIAKLEEREGWNLINV